MPAAKPIRWGLRPDPKSRLYALVQVWPTHKAFLAHINRVGRYTRQRFGRRCQGTCRRLEVYWIPKKGPRRKHRCFAEVNLWRGALGPEVVTHELFHATMAYGYRIKFPFEKLADCTGVTKWEERLTYAHGRMCAQLAEVLDTE